MRPKRLEALLAIGGLLAPTQAASGSPLATGLTQAWDEPEDYADDHGTEIERRGFDGDVDELPWVALIEGLTQAGALVELDDDADAEALRHAVEQLPGCPPGVFAWMKHDSDLAQRSTAELVELTGKAVVAKGALLAQLTGELLRLCLVMVPDGRAAELVKLTRSAGFGEATLITGAQLTRATKDRIAATRRQASRDARSAAHATASTRYFARGKETWTVTAASGTAEFQTCYEKPRVKYYVHHHFDDAAAARAGLKRQLGDWEAAGFHEIERSAFEALPHAETPYINWTAPFPEDASYVVAGKEVVRCLELRGDAVVESAGTIGYNFGELQNVFHCKTAEAAAKRHAQQLAADAHFPAISRDDVVKRYR